MFKNTFKNIAVKRDFLTYVLCMIGVNLRGYRLGLCARCSSFFLTIVLFLTLLHSCLADLRWFVKDGDMTCLVDGMQSAQSLLLWLLFVKERKRIAQASLNLIKYQKRYHVTVGLINLVSNIFTILVILMPIHLTIIWNSYADEDVDSLSNYLSFGFIRLDARFNRALDIYQSLVSYTNQGLPLLLTFSLNVTFFKWSAILKSYKNGMELQAREPERCVRKLKEYFCIQKDLKLLNRSLYHLSFFILLDALYCIFVSLYNILMYDIFDDNISVTIDTLYNFGAGIFILLSFIIFNSKISDELKAIREFSSDLILEYGSTYSASEHILFYLQRIEREDILYLEVCGMFYIDRGLILSAIGATLTYDLLILNFNLS